MPGRSAAANLRINNAIHRNPRLVTGGSSPFLARSVVTLAPLHGLATWSPLDSPPIPVDVIVWVRQQLRSYMVAGVVYSNQPHPAD
jgi:hypothetical protein